ncbi:MAG: DNA alkylation repair protein [Armatimonadetes bacterium]|nr:DNA alkylation repair protein [Armatimonadota bacterium]
MTCQEVVAELESLGTPQIKKIWMNYGAQEPCFGVKVEDMKKILKRVKGDHGLALELYDTGIADAMYLAGLLVDDSKMSETDLEKWLQNAAPGWVADFTVPWVAGSSPHARDTAVKWIGAAGEDAVAAGWSTYSSYLSITPDEKLDLKEVTALLEQVEATVHDRPDRVKSAMNQFVSFVGCYVAPLHDLAVLTATRIGPISIAKNGNCKVPYAPDQIAKFTARGAVGRKRKSAKC